MPGQRFPLRGVARYAPIAVIGGAVIGALLSRQVSARGIIQGALIGFLCFSMAVLAEYLLHPWLERRPEQWWWRAIVYFVASQLGWPLGLIIGLPLIWGRPLSELGAVRPALMTLLIIGAVGTLVGVSIYAYEALKDRLRASIEQLKEKEYADKELELARELQSRMLPAPEITTEGYRISGRNFAARYVAGDFFDVFQYADGSVGVAVADVAGKGIAASLIMASVKAVLPLLAMNRPVDEAMNALNVKLAGELTKREFVALVLARFDPATGSLTIVNAGLPDPYVVRRDGSVEMIEVTGPRLPLGLRRGIAYESCKLTLAPGDALLLLSDGLPEATTDADGAQLGYERLAEIIRGEGANVDAILARIHAETTEIRDDDQTVVLLQRIAAA